MSSHEKIEIQKNDEVKGILLERHILDDEIKMIIHNAETGGEKLFQQDSDHLLASLRIANATFYVEYSIAEENTFVIHTGYSHRTELRKE